MTPAIDDVLAERLRQVTAEGWTPEHDDTHTECQLARAAAVYATCTDYRQLTLLGVTVWPWHPQWWKFTNYRRSLVKAAALLIAEIERLDRKEAANAKAS